MTVLAHLYCSPGVHICFLCYCIFEYRGERRATGRGCRRSPIAFCPTLSPLPFSSAVFRFPSRSAHLWWQSVNDLVSSRFSPLEALIRVLFVLSPSLPPPFPQAVRANKGHRCIGRKRSVAYLDPHPRNALRLLVFRVFLRPTAIRTPRLGLLAILAC